MSEFSLADLASIIKSRRGASAKQSYTKTLFSGGPARIAKKFGEEAVEAVIAGIEGDKQALVGEAADVIYHLLVLLEAREIDLAEVLSELERRTGQSGHQEKASRGAQQ
jgi:phosphoribosyl-ATP pyrophosphohydrolase